jgi:phosphoribosylamine--glycine ligase
MTKEGPKTLEFNVRLGDPETQALMHRMDDGCDFGEALLSAAEGRLATQKLHWKRDPSVAVVLAAHGYPGTVRTGDEIHGVQEVSNAVVFQAGTKLENGKLVTAGGRVLAAAASGATLETAIQNAYDAASHIHFEGMHYRRDIGQKGLKRW